MGTLASLIALALLVAVTWALVGPPIPDIAADKAELKRHRNRREGRR